MGGPDIFLGVHGGLQFSDSLRGALPSRVRVGVIPVRKNFEWASQDHICQDDLSAKVIFYTFLHIQQHLCSNLLGNCPLLLL